MPCANSINLNSDNSITLKNDSEVLNYKDKKTQFRFNRSMVNNYSNRYIVTDQACYDSFGKLVLDIKEYDSFRYVSTTNTGILLFMCDNSNGKIEYMAMDKNGEIKNLGLVEEKICKVKYGDFLVCKDAKIM